MTGIPARDALDALAELNGLVWERGASGSYIVRRAARTAKVPAEVGAALRSALPRDFRIFLAMDPPPESPPGSPFTAGIGRAGNLAYSTGATLGASLPAGMLVTGRDVPYSRLTADQQAQLLYVLVFQSFHPFDQELWADGSWGFHRIRMPEVWLSLDQGQILMVESEGHSAFGQNVMAPPRPPGAR